MVGALMIFQRIDGVGMTRPLSDRPGSDEPPGLVDIYHAHRLAMVRLAILLVDDLATAEDVVQDAFAALHQRWERLNDVNAALGYLRVSVVNAARSVLRRRRTARLYVVPREPDHVSAEGEVMLAAEHVRRALLRETNAAIAAQVRGYYARPWADGDPDAVVRQFVCECGDPRCDVHMRLPVGDVAAAPALAPGHRRPSLAENADQPP
jgi:hypothetical protein